MFSHLARVHFGPLCCESIFSFPTYILYVLGILGLHSPMGLAVCMVFIIAFLCLAFVGSLNRVGCFPRHGHVVRLWRLMQDRHACLSFWLTFSWLGLCCFPCMSLGSCLALVGVLAGLIPQVARLFMGILSRLAWVQVPAFWAYFCCMLVVVLGLLI